MHAFMCDECGKPEVGEPKTISLGDGFLSAEVTQKFPPRTWFVVARAYDIDGTRGANERLSVVCSTDCLMRYAARLVVQPRVKP